jgi:hypothetical protein
MKLDWQEENCPIQPEDFLKYESGTVIENIYSNIRTCHFNKRKKGPSDTQVWYQTCLISVEVGKSVNDEKELILNTININLRGQKTIRPIKEIIKTKTNCLPWAFHIMKEEPVSKDEVNLRLIL